jgi:hypothetical protein
LYFGEQSHSLLQLSIERLAESSRAHVLNDLEDLNMDNDPDYFEYQQLMQQPNDPDQYAIGVGPASWEADQIM